MLRRAHHRQIVDILKQLNPRLVDACEIGFGGGTAISLLHEEYRLSTDIDFMCSSAEGYRALRQIFFAESEKKSFLGGVTQVREFALGRDAVRGLVRMGDGSPVKIEFVLEGRITFEPFEYSLGFVEELAQVPVLSEIDLFSEKLLANADRGLDKAYHSRDLIDLCFMLQAHDLIPYAALDKLHAAYGITPSLVGSLEKCKDMLRDSAYRRHCMTAMQIDVKHSQVIVDNLEKITLIGFRPKSKPPHDA